MEQITPALLAHSTQSLEALNHAIDEQRDAVMLGIYEREAQARRDANLAKLKVPCKRCGFTNCGFCVWLDTVSEDIHSAISCMGK